MDIEIKVNRKTGEVNVFGPTERGWDIIDTVRVISNGRGGFFNNVYTGGSYIDAVDDIEYNREVTIGKDYADKNGAICAAKDYLRKKHKPVDRDFAEFLVHMRAREYAVMRAGERTSRE